MADAPSWVPLIRIAKWLGVAPWELAKQPVFWMRAATTIAASDSKKSETEED